MCDQVANNTRSDVSGGLGYLITSDLLVGLFLLRHSLVFCVFGTITRSLCFVVSSAVSWMEMSIC